MPACCRLLQDGGTLLVVHRAVGVSGRYRQAHHPQRVGRGQRHGADTFGNRRHTAANRPGCRALVPAWRWNPAGPAGRSQILPRRGSRRGPGLILVLALQRLEDSPGEAERAKQGDSAVRRSRRVPRFMPVANRERIAGRTCPHAAGEIARQVPQGAAGPLAASAERRCARRR